jgi:hypothetical protein
MSFSPVFILKICQPLLAQPARVSMPETDPFPCPPRPNDPKARNAFVRLRKIKKFVSLINVLRLAQFKNKGGAYEKA